MLIVQVLLAGEEQVEHRPALGPGEVEDAGGEGLVHIQRFGR